MNNERSLFRELLPLFLLLICVMVAWVFPGPGAHLIHDTATSLTAATDKVADWYQHTFDGPARLIAPLITILSGSYAIYKAYSYAESNLHRKLDDYLKRDEPRLVQARGQLRRVIDRPGLVENFDIPLFLADPLKDAMRELGWGSYFLPPQIGYAETQLTSAVSQLEKQVLLSKERHQSLNRQLATAHLLRGAMLASKGSEARKAGKSDRAFCSTALHHFQSALKFDAKDCDALEYASHMHVCLGEIEEAEELLNKLLKLTGSSPKSLWRARALRLKARIANKSRPKRPGVAVQRLKDALKALPNLEGVEWIEEAELNEELGNIECDLGHGRQARAHFEIAKAIYERIDNADADAGRDRTTKRLNQLSGSAQPSDGISPS